MSTDVVIPVEMALCCGVCLYEKGPVKGGSVDDTAVVIAAPGSWPPLALPGG